MAFIQSWVQVKKSQKDPVRHVSGSPCAQLKYFLKLTAMKHVY